MKTITFLIFLLCGFYCSTIPSDILIIEDKLELTEVEKEFSIPMKFKNEDYMCYFPSSFEKLQLQMDEDSIPEEQENEVYNSKAVHDMILSLMNNLFRKCFYLRTGGWWNYEVCFGGEKAGLNQFHQEPNNNLVKIKLGKGHINMKQFEKNITPHNIHQRYVSYKFIGGDVCDLTKKPRISTVRIFCPSEQFIAKIGGRSHTLYSVNEPNSCSYVALFAMKELCEVPGFKKKTIEKKERVRCIKMEGSNVISFEKRDEDWDVEEIVGDEHMNKIVDRNEDGTVKNVEKDSSDTEEKKSEEKLNENTDEL